jgi:hypothetical protein
LATVASCSPALDSFGVASAFLPSQSPALFVNYSSQIGRQVLPRLIDHYIPADFCENILSRQSGWSMDADKATMQKSASADFAWRQNAWL